MGWGRRDERRVVTRCDLGGADAESVSNLLREIIDNSVDECQYTADKIFIDRDFNGFNIVADNGRGISIEYNKDAPGIISADLSISTLHSGSKFTDNKTSTVGQNGVGSAATCACSEDYILLSKMKIELIFTLVYGRIDLS